MIIPIRKLIRNKDKGFSIIEVVVSALIFSVAATGIIAMTSNVRPKAVVSENEVTAALFAKHVLEWLRAKVDASTWDTGFLSPGNYFNTITIGGTFFNASYAITNDTMSGGRVVDLTVSWDEPD